MRLLGCHCCCIRLHDERSADDTPEAPHVGFSDNDCSSDSATIDSKFTGMPRRGARCPQGDPGAAGVRLLLDDVAHAQSTQRQGRCGLQGGDLY
jgi:hypothetical protein